MALTTLQEALDFLEISYQTFTITSSNDVIKLAYNGGSVTSVDIPDGTYNGTDLATQLATSIDTALSCTSTVTWNATTYKFTIAVATGNTIAYTHSGSDLGLTIGFNDDHSAAVSITSDISVSDPTAIVSVLKDSVEKWIKNYCNRDLESTSYTERYDGDGSSILVLRQYPVTAMTRLAFWPIDVIRVRNTSTTTIATVSVTSSNVVLTKDGSSTNLALATYTTFSSMVDAINAVGSGWEAVVQNSAYNSYLSSHLIEKMGLWCLKSNWGYLQMPYDYGEADFDIDANSGIIYLNRFINSYGTWIESGFPTGTRNIFVDYTAGFSTIPDDLKLAVKIWLKYIFQKMKEENYGVKSFSSGGIRVDFENDIPFEAKMILDAKYRRRMVSSL